MANYPSSVRRIRTNERDRIRNKHYRSQMRTAVKGIRASENKEEAQKRLTSTTSLLDKLASKGIIHKNNAANQKSRLALFVNKL